MKFVLLTLIAGALSMGMTTVTSTGSKTMGAPVSDEGYIYTDNVIANGDFSVGAGGVTEIVLGNGWDNKVNNWFDYSGNDFISFDPTDTTNTCLKFKIGTGFGDAALYIPERLTTGVTYAGSFDFFAPGGSDNIGFHFWEGAAWSHDGNVFFVDDATFYQSEVTDLGTGWKHVSYTYTPAGDADTMAIWGNTAVSTIWLDNFKLIPNGGENVLVEGDLECFREELNMPEIVLGNGWDNKVYNWFDYSGNDFVSLDPTNLTNTVLKFKKGTGFGDAALYIPDRLTTGVTYEGSFDFFAPNGSDNIGFHFWEGAAWSHDGNVFFVDDATFYQSQISDLGNGWKHVSFIYTPAGDADTMAIWGNTAVSAIYLDNFQLVASGQNAIPEGDLEMFKEDFPTGDLPTTPDARGIYAENVVAKVGYVKINEGGKYGVLLPALTSNDYQLDVDYEVSGGATLVAKIFDEGGAALQELTVSEAESGHFKARFGGVALASKIELLNTATGTAKVTGLYLRQAIKSNYNPNIEYYESKNMTVNGDFEAFAEGTVMSEAQLEGAWGSVSLDNPAMIETLEGNKVASIGRHTEADSKTYSSMFLMTPDTLEIGDILRIRYDIKLALVDETTTYGSIDSCLVGGSNTSYYTLNYINGMPEMTSGAEKVHYAVTTKAAANGFTTVEYTFEVTNDIIQWNSIRWLLTPHAVGDLMYIDNVEMHLLTIEPPSNPVTKVTINEGDQELKVGESKQLTYSVAPSGYDATTFTWSSSNESVATVSQSGKVTAVAEGAAKITLTAGNGVKAEIVVTVSAASTEPTQPTQPTQPQPAQPTNVGLIVGLSLAGVVVIAGVIVLVVVLKKKKQ